MSNMQEMRIVFPTPDKLLTPGVVLVLLLTLGGYVGLLVAPNTVLGVLALNPQAVIQGRIWQLVTYPFVDGPRGLIFNGLVILLLGSSIERQWRTASFMGLWLVVSVCCGFLWVVIGLCLTRAPLGFGANACAFGIIAIFGVLFRGRRYLVFFATMEAQYIALGLIAIGFIWGLAYPITLIWVAGALVAYVYVKVRWRLSARAAMSPSGRRSGGTKGQFVDID